MRRAEKKPLFEKSASPDRATSKQNRGELQVHALRKRLGHRWVVDGVTLTVRQGEIVGLLGPNGAGKTVTFSLISGLLDPDEGHVRLNGEEIISLPMYERARLGIAYLPQERSVFRGLTAEENVTTVLEANGMSRKDAQQQAGRILDRFGLSRLSQTRATKLSGGEQRRLEVARSVAVQPLFLLSDEPFTGIDPLTIEMLRGLFASLRDSGLGILLTDHNVRETLSLCDRAYVLFNGRVLAQGKPEELLANPIVRRHFLGDTFTLEGPSADVEAALAHQG